jgi:hypothetical protein
MYCSLNEALIDMSGNGVEDCQGRPPVLRIPYPENQWGTWMHLYHRWINLWRWFKFRARGQVSSSNDAADMKFVCEQLAKHCGDEDLRQTFVDYMGGEVKQKSDAQKMEYARKLHGVFCDDYANAMGVEANEAAVWFAASMLGWMPDWFKAVVEAPQEEKQTKKEEKEKRQKEKEKKKKEKEEGKKAKKEAKEGKNKEKKEKQEKKIKEKEEAKKAKAEAKKEKEEDEAAAAAAGTVCVGNSNSVGNHR